MKNLFNKLPYALTLSLACLLAALFMTACNKDTQVVESTHTSETMTAPTYVEPVVAPVEEVASAAGIMMEEIALCEEVVSHAPVNEKSTFYADGGRAYLYTKVTMEAGESDYIRHIWYRNGKEMNNVKLDVRGPSHRTHSYKTLFEGQDGEWTVDVVASNGDLIETVAFDVY